MGDIVDGPMMSSMRMEMDIRAVEEFLHADGNSVTINDDNSYEMLLSDVNTNGLDNCDLSRMQQCLTNLPGSSQEGYEDILIEASDIPLSSPFFTASSLLTSASDAVLLDDVNMLPVDIENCDSVMYVVNDTSFCDALGVKPNRDLMLINTSEDVDHCNSLLLDASDDQFMEGGETCLGVLEQDDFHIDSPEWNCEEVNK